MTPACVGGCGGFAGLYCVGFAEAGAGEGEADEGGAGIIVGTDLDVVARAGVAEGAALGACVAVDRDELVVRAGAGREAVVGACGTAAGGRDWVCAVAEYVVGRGGIVDVGEAADGLCACW